MSDKNVSKSVQFSEIDLNELLSFAKAVNDSKDKAKDAHEFLSDELKKESDRGAILVGTSILEVRLQELISEALVATENGDDVLFSGANAPLSAFSAKIDVAFRLGLISARLRNDLHVLRRIRSDCAHRPAGCSFEDDSIRDRTNNISSQHIFLHVEKYYADGVDFNSASTRSRYIETVSWINFFLIAERERIISDDKKAKERRVEFAYLDPREHS